MTIIAEKQCAATPHPLRGGVPEGRGGVWTRLSCSGKRLLSSSSGRLHNQEHPFSEKVSDPTPNPSPTREGRTSGTILQGRGELRGLSYKGRGELRGLSYKGGENFGDYSTREGRTSETILQGRGVAVYRCSKGDFIKWA